MIASTDGKPIAMDREASIDQSHKLSSARSPGHEKHILQMVSAFVYDHPGASLLIALTLGGLAGWFSKRRK